MGMNLTKPAKPKSSLAAGRFSLLCLAALLGTMAAVAGSAGDKTGEGLETVGAFQFNLGTAAYEVWDAGLVILNCSVCPVVLKLDCPNARFTTLEIADPTTRTPYSRFLPGRWKSPSPRARSSLL